MYSFSQSFPQILIPRKHSLQDILGASGISLHKKCLNFEIFKILRKIFLLKVHVDVVWIFLTQITFDISVWFHFGIT